MLHTEFLLITNDENTIKYKLANSVPQTMFASGICKHKCWKGILLDWKKPIHSIACMWSVAACGVWQHVECGSMWSVAACGVWQHVECGSMWSVAPCGVWQHVECGSMWSVAACGVWQHVEWLIYLRMYCATELLAMQLSQHIITCEITLTALKPSDKSLPGNRILIQWTNTICQIHNKSITDAPRPFRLYSC
jgi:hypothetical protein